jgi:hypothetical protein
MRGTGAESSVVGLKVLQWDWTEGTALFSRGPAERVNDFDTAWFGI